MILTDKPLVVLEMANNHQGNVDHGKKIIESFADVCKGFDDFFEFVIKFQYRNLETFVHKQYRDSDIKYVRRFLDTELTQIEWQDLINHSRVSGFKTMCTPFDEISVQKVVKDKFDYLKIASASIDDWPLIEEISKTKMKIVASVGGASIEKIKRFYTFMKNREKDFALNYCVSVYPTSLKNLNLEFISYMKKIFPDIEIGFSTHEGNDSFNSGALAYAQGARIFEKHIALEDPTLGISVNDYSCQPLELETWLKNIVQSILILGSVENRERYLSNEIEALRPLKRGVFLKKSLSNNKIIETSDLYFAIPCDDEQLLANDISKFNNIQLLKDKYTNDKLDYSDVKITDNKKRLESIRDKIAEILIQSNVNYLNGKTIEISHHYGIEEFEKFGSSLITLINQKYCKKVIVMLANQENPEHYHLKKDETFILLNGDLKVKLDQNIIKLQPGETLHIPVNSKHSFSSIGGAVFEEISTTHFTDDSYYSDKQIMENLNRKSYIPLI